MSNFSLKGGKDPEIRHDDEDEQEGGAFAGHYPCVADEVAGKRSCASSDALCVYEHEDEETGELWYDAYCRSCNQVFSKGQLKNTSVGDELGVGDGSSKPVEKRGKKTPSEPLTLEQAKAFINLIGYESNNYRGIDDEYSKFYGHLTKMQGGVVLARYYPETLDGKLVGYKCRNHPKDFRFGKMGMTGQKCDLSGYAKFKKGGGKYCVPMDTKALTFRGWKSYEDIKVGDYVLGYDQGSHTKQWTKVVEKHFVPQQKVYQFGSGLSKLRSTKNHRWFVNQRSTESDHSIKTWERQVRTLDKFTTETRLIVNAPFLRDSTVEKFVDESFCRELTQGKYEIDWVDRVLKMSQNERVAFLEGFLIADGCYNGSYWLGSQNDGDIFEAVLLASYLVHDKIVRVKPRKPNEKGNVLKDIILSNSEHRSRLTENVEYLGVEDTWCITTELGSWVMRQGDVINITGNCLLVGGEEDKVAAYQMLRESQKNKAYNAIPVVSPTVGETGCAKQISRFYEWFDSFDHVILGFDNDDESNAILDKICDVLPKEKVRIAKWSGKDPNDMLKKGREQQFLRDFYDAKPLISSELKSSSDATNEVIDFLSAPKISLPAHMHRVQDNMRGGIRSTGGVINLIGDTSIGKTFLSDTLMYHWSLNEGMIPTVVSLERTAGELLIDLYSLHLKKNLMWFKDGMDAIDYLDRSEVKAMCEELVYFPSGQPRFYILDERDGDIETLQRTAERAHKQFGSKIIIFDPLTDFLRSLTLEAQEEFMMWEKFMKKEGIIFLNVLHTRKPQQDKDGKFKKSTEYDALGSGTFVQSADTNWVVNRNKMAACPVERNTTVLDMPKCRGGTTGHAADLIYDPESRTQMDSEAYFAVKGKPRAIEEENDEC